jgi:hypothetical protein
MVFSLEHDIKVTKNHQNLLPTQSVPVAHTVVPILYTKVKKFMIIARAPRLEPEACRGF